MVICQGLLCCYGDEFLMLSLGHIYQKDEMAKVAAEPKVSP